MKKHFGLGKGLGSLIPKDAKSLRPVEARENIFYVETHKIRPNPDQPRKEFDKDTLGELAKSIKKYGVLQPLLVAKVEEENPRGMNVYYQLIAGERRLRASQLAGLPQVPVIIRDDVDPSVAGKTQRLELALIENIQREDLNSMEEAEAYARLAGEFGLTQQEIAQKVSKSREAVANTLRLLKLPQYARDALRDGRINAAQARALLSFSDQSKQKEVYEQILKGGFSSKDVEAKAASAKSLNPRTRRYDDLEKNLTDHLKAPVLIKASDKGGQIVIRFATHEELNSIAKNIID